MAKTALLVIDMQNAYFNNSALEEHRSQLIYYCNKLITHAQQHSWPTFMVRTVHAKDTSTWTLNMLDDARGYLYDGDEDAQLVRGLKVNGTIKLPKTRDSAFYDTTLLTQLREREIERLVLCGVSTHSCIMLTAADAYAANLRVTLASDAIYSHDPRYHESTLEMLQQEYRQGLLTHDAIIEQTD